MGMLHCLQVPDVHHILAKGGGVFCNPTSPSAPAKLRVLYECMPLAFVIEAAGGASLDGTGSSALNARLLSHDQRSSICLGSVEEVARCTAAMLL
jgi:sedoheptulose-bisphosphatase